MVISPPKYLRDFASLLSVVRGLRAPDGCPWDREQTHQTLTRFVIEEAHELAEAIDDADDGKMKDELGDVLLQVVLHSVIAEQRHAFNIEDVIENLNRKMIRRHPHVFSDKTVGSANEVIRNWNEIKAQEKAAKPVDTVFDFPRQIPALIAAQKIGEKSGRFQFDWDSPEQVFEKVREEFHELEETVPDGTPEERLHEIGDLLFSVTQLARHWKIDAEQALRVANTRFEKRFRTMLDLIEASGRDIKKMRPEDIENVWQDAKKSTTP
jgi:tetrapyrrole methylase family protein/MazG family protein